jgi:EAL domain-containing protein (putative c-di-GMP-specific phosphodiesterase class I)/CheY-like chemotaxis protein
MPPGTEPNYDDSAILLVDDDARLLAVLQRALSAPTVHVHVASSGAAALELLAQRRFDAVVSDIQMPGMNGLKLLYAVREHDSDLPVVLMTGNPDLKTATAAVAYGAFQYLIKPVENERLRAVVERAVDTGRIARLKRECSQEFGSGSFYVGDRAGIESKLNRALQSLWMVYQPIVRASDGTVYGYEALLRSEEPMLPHPGAVLRAAEKLHRVQDVGRAVREAVALDLDRVNPDAFLFVNLHPEDLMDPALYVRTAPLTRVASRVVLELSDRASLEDVIDAPARLERLRQLGFRIALDDLGAGQSDPSTFDHLQAEFVKLDIAVVRGVDQDDAKNKIVRSMVRLCHKMGKAVIAEGVENEREHSALIRAECDFLQGYFLRTAGLLDEQWAKDRAKLGV